MFARRCFGARNRPQPFASDSCGDKMAVPMASSAKAGTFVRFCRFQMSRSFASRGRRGAL